VVSAIQKLARAVSVKYSYIGFNQISYKKEIMVMKDFYNQEQPPQNQQIDFLISQAAALQDSIYEYVENMVTIVRGDIKHYSNYSEILENPNLITANDLSGYILEELVKLILIEDIIQDQIFKLTKRILDEQNVEFSLQGIQVKASPSGMEKHINKHGDLIGVIRPPQELLQNGFSTEYQNYTHNIDQLTKAYIDMHTLD
jgi:hypothetical protein